MGKEIEMEEGGERSGGGGGGGSRCSVSRRGKISGWDRMRLGKLTLELRVGGISITVFDKSGSGGSGLVQGPLFMHWG